MCGRAQRDAQRPLRRAVPTTPHQGARMAASPAEEQLLLHLSHLRHAFTGEGTEHGGACRPPLQRRDPSPPGAPRPCRLDLAAASRTCRSRKHRAGGRRAQVALGGRNHRLGDARKPGGRGPHAPRAGPRGRRGPAGCRGSALPHGGSAAREGGVRERPPSHPRGAQGHPDTGVRPWARTPRQAHQAHVCARAAAAQRGGGHVVRVRQRGKV